MSTHTETPSYAKSLRNPLLLRPAHYSRPPHCNPPCPPKNPNPTNQPHLHFHGNLGTWRQKKEMVPKGMLQREGEGREEKQRNRTQRGRATTQTKTPEMDGLGRCGHCLTPHQSPHCEQNTRKPDTPSESFLVSQSRESRHSPRASLKGQG